MAVAGGRGHRRVLVVVLGLGLVVVLGAVAVRSHWGDDAGVSTSFDEQPVGPLGLVWREVSGDASEAQMLIGVGDRIFVFDTETTTARLLVWDGADALTPIEIAGDIDIGRILSIDADADRVAVALTPRVSDLPIVAAGAIGGPLAVLELPVPDEVVRDNSYVGWIRLAEDGIVAAGSGSLGRAFGAHSIPLRWTSVDGSTWAVEPIALDAFGSPPEGYVNPSTDLVLTTTDDQLNAQTIGNYYSADAERWVDVTAVFAAVSSADGPTDLRFVDDVLYGVLGFDGMLHRWRVPTNGALGADEPVALPAANKHRFAAGRLGVAFVPGSPDEQTLHLMRGETEWRHATISSLPGVAAPPGWSTSVNMLEVSDTAVALQLWHSAPDDGDESTSEPPPVVQILVGTLPR